VWPQKSLFLAYSLTSFLAKRFGYCRRMDLRALEEEVRRFAGERDWDQFHSVRNLLLALVGEVGELSELLQWVSDAEVSTWLEAGGRERFAEELADVLLYLVRLADKTDVDLSDAAVRKLKVNGEKYPVELSRGSSQKYDELK
jgi:dCTP diphosphatase